MKVVSRVWASGKDRLPSAFAVLCGVEAFTGGKQHTCCKRLGTVRLKPFCGLMAMHSQNSSGQHNTVYNSQAG